MLIFSAVLLTPKEEDGANAAAGAARNRVASASFIVKGMGMATVTIMDDWCPDVFL